MPSEVLPLNTYHFRMQSGSQAWAHDEVNNTLTRALRKAAGWIYGIWMENPSAILEHTVTPHTDEINIPTWDDSAIQPMDEFAETGAIQ